MISNSDMNNARNLSLETGGTVYILSDGSDFYVSVEEDMGVEYFVPIAEFDGGELVWIHKDYAEG